LMVGPALGVASERCHTLAEVPEHRCIAPRVAFIDEDRLTSAALARDATLRQYRDLSKLTSLDFLPRSGFVTPGLVVVHRAVGLGEDLVGVGIRRDECSTDACR
jgi:hypothetical protein